ncbi:MAG TPA: acetate--CoA ligase family protein, partial [Planctomycetota bacterium]|nr:acetate--CoA ligase family protein [Planctomycetota bacterium]
DVLDWLSRDPNVRSILLYIESVRNPRKFLSAARGASRAKTVIALKAGRAPEGAKAAMTHTGALAGADEVWDAALRRAGVLRVSAISELFEGVETLARARTPRGDKLLVFTNGGGPGVIAIDALVRGGGSLADLSPSLLERLDRELPATWSRSNPIDIIGDADSTRFGKALGVVLDETKEDSVLVLHVPTAVLSAASAAQTTAAEAQGREGNVLSCFMGGAQAESARRIAAGAGLPVYDTPESAVRAFLHTIHYRRSRRELLETPPSLPGDLRFDTERAQEVIQRALDEGRHYLGDVESREVLRAYGFPVVESRVARDASEAERVAREIEPPYVVKIVSPDVVHKSDVGGVVLNVQTA